MASPIAASPEFTALQAHAAEVKQGTSVPKLRELLQDDARSAAFKAEADGIYLDYTRQNATMETKEMLLALARAANLEEKKAKMFSGAKINTTEGRSVLHVALRAPRTKAIVVDGVDQVAEVHKVLDSIQAFSGRVRSGAHVGCTGKPLTTVVAVGIGGSYLGPEFLFEALKTDPAGAAASKGRTLRFLANVDPVDFKRATEGLDPEETLVIIVSKTFTTAETMLNARTMRQWLWDRMSDGEPDAAVTSAHMVACASESAASKVADFGIGQDRFFKFWDWVGGRYSVCSSAGLVPLSLKYGYDLLAKVLAGARSMDVHFFNAPLHANIPVLMGLLGVWNLSFLGYTSRTMLPYSEALCKFPAHVQQVDMESNGKGVRLDGKAVDYDVGEVDFGESGTNSQHSFFQLLHMGQAVPCDFIGFVKAQNNLVHTEGEDLSSHDELMANFFAQPDALALGRTAEQLLALEPGIDPKTIPHRVFPGNRPSLSLLFPQLDAYTAGQMLALYEHRTAVQGFLWDINSFDQWGVELGKTLAGDMRSRMIQGRKVADAVKEQQQQTQSQAGQGAVADGVEGQGTPAAAAAQVLEGLNPSTSHLMQRYFELGGVETADPEEWRSAPSTLLAGSAREGGEAAANAAGGRFIKLPNPVRFAANAGRRLRQSILSPTDRYFDGFKDGFPDGTNQTKA